MAERSMAIPSGAVGLVLALRHDRSRIGSHQRDAVAAAPRRGERLLEPALGQQRGAVALRACIGGPQARRPPVLLRSEEHTSELQSPCNLVCRLLLEKKKQNTVQTCICLQ